MTNPIHTSDGYYLTSQLDTGNYKSTGEKASLDLWTRYKGPADVELKYTITSSEGEDLATNSMDYALDTWHNKTGNPL
jgi:hypothetical protein